MTSRTPLLALAFALSLPLAAQERFAASLTYDQLKGKSQTLDPVQFSPKDNSGLGLAFAWSTSAARDAGLDLTVAYRFRGTSDFVVSGPGFSDAATRYRYQHIALGARYMWHKPFDFGFGLQYRFEKLAIEPKDQSSESWTANQARPWLGAEAGYTFQGGSIKPFVALSVALPLTSEDKPTGIPLTDAQAKANQEQLVKSTAPRFEIAVKAGIRF